MVRIADLRSLRAGIGLAVADILALFEEILFLAHIAATVVEVALAVQVLPEVLLLAVVALIPLLCPMASFGMSSFFTYIYFGADIGLQTCI